MNTKNSQYSLLAMLAGAFLLLLGSVALAAGLPLYLWLVHGELQGAWLIGGCAYVVALVPAFLPLRDEFQPPGPQVTAADHPAFFKLLTELCESLNQRPPDQVYLLPVVNAFVTHRGGLLGMGSKRVLAVGLPLIAGLSKTEMLAVLAHEMGHFHNGDVRMGPWIYRLREALGRAMLQVRESSGPLYRPVRQFFLLFLRRSETHSRQQEFHADAIAARTVGSAIAERALRRMAGLASAWNSYQGMLYVPILCSGNAPPLLSGFVEFLQVPEVSRALEEIDALGVEEQDGHPFDSHPSDYDRCRALRNMDLAAVSPLTGQALDLFAGASLHDTLIRFLHEDLQPIRWDQVPRLVLVPHWADQLSRVTSAVPLPTYQQLPELLTAGAQGAAEVAPGLSHDQAQIAALLVLVLAGVSSRYSPAEGIEIRVGGRYQDADSVLASLAAGLLRPSTWSDLVCRAGLAARSINELSEHVPARVDPDQPVEAVAARSRRRQLSGLGGWLLGSGGVIAAAAWIGQRGDLASIGLVVALVIAAVVLVSGLVLIYMTPLLSRVRLQIEGDQLTLTRRGRTQSIPVQQIRRIRCWYRDRSHERSWNMTFAIGGSGRIQIAHSQVDEDDDFAVLCERLLNFSLVRLTAEFDRGERVAVSANAAISSEGLHLADKVIAWNDLAKPRVIDDHISVFQTSQSEPCLQLPPWAPDQRAIASLISQQTDNEEVDDAKGAQIYQGWTLRLSSLEQFLFACLVGLPLLVSVRPSLWPLLVGWFVVSAYPLLRALSARVTIFERAVAERTLFGTRTVSAEALRSVRREGARTLLILADGQRFPMRVHVPKTRPAVLDLSTHIFCKELQDRWLNELEDESQVHWCEGTWIRHEDIADADTQISLRIDESLRMDFSQSELLLYASAEPEAVIALSLEAENLLVGQLLLESMVEYAVSSAAAQAVSGNHSCDGSGSNSLVEANSAELADCIAEMRVLWSAAAPSRAQALIDAYPMPDFLAEHPCPVHSIYADLAELAAAGSVVWGAVIQAHSDLYDAAYTEPRLAALVYADADTQPAALDALAKRLFLIKGRLMRLQDAAEQRFADLLEDEVEQQLRLEVPGTMVAAACAELSTADPSLCVYTTSVIHPGQLPMGRLSKGLVPLLIAPGHTDAVLVLPSQFWSPAFVAWWDADDRADNRAEVELEEAV